MFYVNYVNYSIKEEYNYFIICYFWLVKLSIEYLISYLCFELNFLDYYVLVFDVRFVILLFFDDVSGFRLLFFLY